MPDLGGAEPVGVDVVLGRRPADGERLAGGVERAGRRAPLSQCSAKRVQPMPTMATRSLIPWLPISASTAEPRLPEVVVDAVGGEQPAERHLDPGADAHLVGVDVGELDRQPAAAVEVDDREHDRRAGRVGEPVDGEGGDRARGVGHRDVGGVAGLRRQVHLAVVVRRADEPELPVRRAAGRRRRRAGRLGPARRLDRRARPASAGTCRRRSARRRRPGRRPAAAGVHAGDGVGGAEEERRRRRRPAPRAR